MRTLPTPQQLRYLLALDETQHVGRAAHRCAVTQSTLSAGIIQLERQLDARILDRDAGKLLVSSAGHPFPYLLSPSAEAGKEPGRAEKRFLNHVLRGVLIPGQPPGQVVRGIQVRQGHLLEPLPLLGIQSCPSAPR